MELTRRGRHGPGWSWVLLAGVVGGLLFNAFSLGLRAVTGAPSFPENVSDLTIPLIPASLFGQLLDRLGPNGKQILVGGSIAGSTIAFITAAAIYGSLIRRGWRPGRLAILLGVVGFGILAALFNTILDANDYGGDLVYRRFVGLLTLAVSVLPAVAVIYLGAVRLPLSPRGSARATRTEGVGRRAFVLSAATAAGGVLLAGGGLWGALRSFAMRTNLSYEGMGTYGMDLAPLTATRDHYVVSKNLVDPTVDPTSWRLEIRGLVANSVTLRMDDLRRLPQREEIVTLECIANNIGGGLMSTARWRGPGLDDVLRLAGASDARAKWAIVTAVDGYYDSLPLDVARDPAALLALEMNGEPLPTAHGFPARVVVPGLYGEKNMKWLAGIELSESDHTGFYQREGWSEAAVARTWSKIDNLAAGSVVTAGALFAVRGHAFAGRRGIQRVEVSTDDGTSWFNTDLDASISPFAWRFFTWRWTPESPGKYRLAVRATDGSGTLQESQPEPVVPRGVAGLHRFTVTAT